jgi:hypothetical protein
MMVRKRDAALWQEFIREHSLEPGKVFDGGRHGKVFVVEL